MAETALPPARPDERRPLAGQITRTRITLRDVTVHSIIGVYPHERETAQPLTISVGVDVERAQSDMLSSTVDYSSILDAITRTTDESYALIESFAHQVGLKLIQNPLVSRVDVEVEKPGAVPKGIAGVSCSIIAT